MQFPLLPLTDGTYVPLDPTINAGTAGVQYFLSLFNNRAVLGLRCERAWDFSKRITSFLDIPLTLTSPRYCPQIDPGSDAAALRKGDNLVVHRRPTRRLGFRFSVGCTGFCPPGEPAGCVSSDAWVVAVADGLILRAENGAVVQDLDNDGYEQTGWTVLYMHVETRDRVQPNTYVYAGERIGHPSCEGGVSNGTHLHLARRFNGESILQMEISPLIWRVGSPAEMALNTMVPSRGGTVVEAWEGVFEDLNQISR